MQAESSFDFFAQWRRRLDQPIVTTLLLSLSLHLALLILVQPAPGGGEEQASLVIQARLVEPTPEPSEAVPEVPPEVVAEAPPMPRAETEEKPSTQSVMPPLLTSPVPSPAPPLPVAPTPMPEPHPQIASVPTAPPVPVNEPRPVTPAATEIRPTPIAAGQPARSEKSPTLGVGVDTTWYLARQVDKAARAADSIVPEYPEEARRRNQEGSLKLMVKIDDLGRVRDVEVVEADIPGLFDAAALEAFRQARFQPAIKDGRPVRYQAYIRVVFRLRD